MLTREEAGTHANRVCIKLVYLLPRWYKTTLHMWLKYNKPVSSTNLKWGKNLQSIPSLCQTKHIYIYIYISDNSSEQIIQKQTNIYQDRNVRLYIVLLQYIVVFNAICFVGQTTKRARNSQEHDTQPLFPSIQGPKDGETGFSNWPLFPGVKRPKDGETRLSSWLHLPGIQAPKDEESGLPNWLLLRGIQGAKNEDTGLPSWLLLLGEPKAKETDLPSWLHLPAIQGYLVGSISQIYRHLMMKRQGWILL